MKSLPSMLPQRGAFTLSVSGRVLLLTVIVWVGLLAGLHGVLSRVFEPTFEQIEARLMVKDLERVEAAVEREVEQLMTTVADYSSWEDMRLFIEASQDHELPKALRPEILRTLDLDAIFVFDELGRVKHAVSQKGETDAKEYTPQGFANQFPVIASVRTTQVGENEAQGGLVRFKSRQLVLAASAPVWGIEESGRAFGTVVMLREFDAEAIRRLADQVRLPVQLTADDPSGPAGTARDATPTLSKNDIFAEAWVRDPFGQPVARFAIRRPANILSQGADTVNLGGIGSLAMLSLVLAMLLLLLQLTVVRPLKHLTRSIENVRRTGDLGLRVGSKRHDEIGMLAYHFDRLLVLLQERTHVLEELATTDGLTKLLNRRTIMERLSEEMERSREERYPFSVLLFDIDHFKKINDSCGHAVGDRVLRAVSENLRSVLSSGDVAGRYGGEEFLILLPRAGRSEAIETAERVRKAIERRRVQGVDWPVTVSVGVACWIGHTKHGLLATADMNLYRAKEAGRNRVVADDIPFAALPAASIPPPNSRSSVA